jgi:hypothetical protein
VILGNNHAKDKEKRFHRQGENGWAAVCHQMRKTIFGGGSDSGLGVCVRRN